MQLTSIPSQVLAAFGLAPNAELVDMPGGHINDTFLVGGWKSPKALPASRSMAGLSGVS